MISGDYINSNGYNVGKFTTLPTDLSPLSHLESLDLSHNDIGMLPQSIGDLINLKHLDLRNNALNTLPDSITELKGLESISLSGNQLTDLSSKVIQFLEDLGLTIDDWKPDTDDSSVN